MPTTQGLHHITAITKDAQANLDFYEGFLGQRFVKRTVNFDDPSVYHLYYGDYVGTPGTALTFFNWSELPPGTRGYGEANAFYYRTPKGSLGFWRERAQKHEVTALPETLFGESTLKMWDPDNHILYLVESDAPLPTELQDWHESLIPEEYRLLGFYGIRLAVLTLDQIKPTLTDVLGYQEKATDGLVRFSVPGDHGIFVDVIEEPHLPQARQGTGSIHHVAFRAKDDPEREEFRAKFMKEHLHPTGMIDRLFFHSTYCMTPAGILFEIATDEPGFTVNEPAEVLGEHLVLPAQYEPLHATLEQTLPPLHLPRHANN